MCRRGEHTSASRDKGGAALPQPGARLDKLIAVKTAHDSTTLIAWCAILTSSVCTSRRKESARKPGSVLDSHSSRPDVAVRLQQPTRKRRGPRHRLPIWPCSRWGLPCHVALSPRAVRSYRTVSPLPRMSCDTVRRFVFCCTFRRLAPPRRYLAPCPMEPGLSSALARRDCPADSTRKCSCMMRAVPARITMARRPRLCRIRRTARAAARH